MGMAGFTQLVQFRLGERRYALPLAAVERVVRAVDVTPLPGAPFPVLGMIDVAGSVLPVFSLRRRFQLEDRAVGPGDQFLIARTRRLRVALVIDEAQAVLTQAEVGMPDGVGGLPGTELIRGVVRMADGLVLIQDLEQFLAPGEARSLDAALARAQRS